MTGEKMKVHFAFDDLLFELKLTQIIPLKLVSKSVKKSSKFKQIKTSIQSIGIIEPLVVKKERKPSQSYILLDGHLRLESLRQLGILQVKCMLSSDDETYTYNKYISRIAPVQEHRMILQAIKRGVSEQKIAEALNIDVRSIAMKRNLLKGICPEVVEILKDKIVGFAVFRELRKMKSIRQIESVKLMDSANNYTVNYARMLVIATPQDQLIAPNKSKRLNGLNAEQLSRMEAEMQQLQKEFILIEESYGNDVMQHTLIKSYLRTLLQNNKIKAYLKRTHDEILNVFEGIIAEA